MKLKKDFFVKLLIYIFPIIIVIDIINRYLINNYILYILNNIMYVGYFIMILVFLFSKNKKRKELKNNRNKLRNSDRISWFSEMGLFFVVSRITKFTSEI